MVFNKTKIDKYLDRISQNERLKLLKSEKKKRGLHYYFTEFVFNYKEYPWITVHWQMRQHTWRAWLDAWPTVGLGEQLLVSFQ